MKEGFRYSPDSRSKESLAEGLAPIADTLASSKFSPAPPLHISYFQSVASVSMPRFIEKKKYVIEKREFVRVAENAEIALDYSLHRDYNKRPTVVIIPGVTGSSSSPFSVGVANKAVHYDLNAVRVNLRSAGDTGSRSSTLYHAGLSEDIWKVLEELNNKGLARKLYIAAVSLGGNTVLKAIGEMGEQAKERIGGIAVVSPVVNMKNIDGNINRLYEPLILRTLKKKVKEKARSDPEDWDISLLNGIKTVEQWNSAYQVGSEPLRWGFIDVQDYYQKASALPYVSKIHVPTFIIHAEDDPVVSFLPLRGEEFRSNPNIIVMLTKHGGHGGFVNFRRREGDLDRHWGQNRVIEFFRLLEENSAQSMR